MSSAKIWREIAQRYRLEGSKCAKCGTAAFPPRSTCPKCGSTDMKMYALPRSGKVLTYSLIHSIPKGFEANVPYPIALVELDDGTKITSQLTDCDGSEIAIGMPVEMTVRIIREDSPSDIIIYGYKFRPKIMREDRKSD
ncbi:MAG: Zn-ribbon domain-containing OB-fold protein [Promethearchaeati archaeon SRVP18_Atabeyarchaeia-1]